MGHGEDRVWSQARQDHRAWEDQSVSRQDRTRGHGGKRRGGQREQEAAAAGVGEVYTRGSQRGRVAASAEWPSLKQFQNQPVMRGGQGAQCLLASQV
ncbi:hypothetical protein PBY51_015926 [Eleginops maclovinus]|uniref:Uncharacterized protein n=1 Tax=Eleginops maclovinus TaxID=56733 RepID=A0AAN7XIB6_ELEMC|nr:hypothetical protein PBY51_015926 [Eleginops maclovinus]